MSQLVTVTQVHSVKAAIVKGALEAEGIPAQLDRDGLGVVYGFEAGPWATRVLVPVEHLEAARALLHEIEGDLR